MNADREKRDSDRLFTSLIRCVQERQSDIITEIEDKQKAEERRAAEVIDMLEEEIKELKKRNGELQELKNTEDHLHLLQVTLKGSFWFWFDRKKKLKLTSSFSKTQKLPLLTSPLPSRKWTEITVHTELCVGTVRKALSKVDITLKNELDSLKKEGKV